MSIETPGPVMVAHIESDSPPPECPAHAAHPVGRALRPELAAIIPPRMRARQIDRRGYSVPWFVEYINGEPDFRVIDSEKHLRALKHRLCWLCGEKLGRRVTFVIGPMCLVNRNTSEPGSHLDCAEYAAKGCPFLTLPSAKYRDANLPGGERTMPVGALDHNPGAMVLYTCRDWQPYIARDPSGRASVLLRLGEPETVTFWHKGRLATRTESLDAIERGLPKLEAIAEAEGLDALNALASLTNIAKRYLPT